MSNRVTIQAVAEDMLNRQVSAPWLVACGLLERMLQKSLQSNTILMNSMVTAVASTSSNWPLASQLFSGMSELNIPYSQVSFGATFSENWARSLVLLQKMSDLQLQLLVDGLEPCLFSQINWE